MDLTAEGQIGGAMLNIYGPVIISHSSLWHSAVILTFLASCAPSATTRAEQSATISLHRSSYGRGTS
jgi:hypothetical protein